MMKPKAQITVEYLLLFAVVILVLLVALSSNGPVAQGLNGFFNGVGDKLGEIVK